MSNRYKQNRNGGQPQRVTTFNGTAIVIAVVTAILALAIVIIGVGSSWFTNPAIKTWFGATEQEQPLPDESQSVVVTPEDENSELTIVTRAIPRAQFASYGIESRAVSAHEVNVTFTPANTTNKKVTLTAGWKNPASTWAKNKNLADYFTLTQDANQAPHATFQVKQAFGEPIEIKAVSVMKPSVTATGRVDYVARIEELAGLKLNSQVDLKSFSITDGVTIQEDDNGAIPYTVMPDRVEGRGLFSFYSELGDLLTNYNEKYGNNEFYSFDINDKFDLADVLEFVPTDEEFADVVYRVNNGNISDYVYIGECTFDNIKFYYNNQLIYTYSLCASSVLISGSYINSNITPPDNMSLPNWAV